MPNVRTYTALIVPVLASCLCLCSTVYAQVKEPGSDTAKVYKTIESFSQKRKFTSLIYNIIFEPIDYAPTVTNDDEQEKDLIPYADFEGKIIRKINVVTLNPFGYSAADSTFTRRNLVTSTGNALHIRTRPFTIRNQLLFRKSDVFDSLLVRESERLIRDLSYVHDVAFFVRQAETGADSVDITVRVLDIWSIIPDGSLSSSSATVKLTDKNLGGLGHSFNEEYTRYFDNGTYATDANYTIRNIRNTYIGASFGYYRDQLGNYNKSIEFERPLFSSFTRWGGGLQLAQQREADSVYQNDSLNKYLTRRFNLQDAWIAGSWQWMEGKSEKQRTSRIIASFRVLRQQFIDKPAEADDPNHLFMNQTFCLAGLSFASRKYITEQYIFKFGLNENVPVGKVFTLTTGYHLNDGGRWYWGLRSSMGNFYSWGYFGTELEYGSFINAMKVTEGIFRARLNYFTGLFVFGNWKFRQFIKPEFTIGVNRLPGERLTINDGYGLSGFSSTGLTGDRRLLLTIQTQSYAPWRLWGFRFGPYINFSLGMLGENGSGFRNSKPYKQFGLGVLIKNEFLVLNTFQLSLAFYPTIPGDGTNVFKTNPLKTTDIGFQNLELGKPGFLLFE